MLQLITSPAPLFIFVVVLLVLAKKADRKWQERKFAREHGCLPPPTEPNRDPILGLDKFQKILTAARENRILPLSYGRFQQNGNTFQSNVLLKRGIHTIEPKNVQTILALNFNDFEMGKRRKHAFGPLLGSGIFAADGKEWEHSRALLRPSFTRTRISEVDIYERHLHDLISRIPQDGSTVDLQELFFCLTLDTATEFLFGESVNSLGTGLSVSSSNFAENFSDAQDGIVHRIRLGSFSWMFPNAKFDNAVREARSFVGQFVQRGLDYQEKRERKQAPEESYVFLDQLAQQTTDKTELTDQLLNILLAGRDTTASLLSMEFFILAGRPDVLKKLRAEISTLDGRPPSFEQLRDLKYLTWVLNETLRLYPVIPRNVRTAVRDTCLPLGGGPDGKSPVFVKKGQNITFDVYSMHRRPDIYGPDVDEFKPERWNSVRPGWGYLPFSGGPRICIGQQFALTEARYTTVRMLQHFSNIESRDSKPWQELLTVTCASKNGTKVSLTPA